MAEVLTAKAEPAASASRSGTEKRARSTALAVRLTPDERATLTEKAHAAGDSLGAFLRRAALETAGPRSRRSVPIDAKELGKAVAALNKAGSNLNQIVRTLNAAGVMQSRENAAVLAEVQAAVADIRRAVGRADRA